jgi:hypothetical protein
MKSHTYKGTNFKGAKQNQTCCAPCVEPPRQANKPAKGKTGSGMMYNKRSVTHQSENPHAPHNPHWI